MKLTSMNAGMSLRKLMTENEISAKQLGKDLGLSNTTITALRKEKLISGRNLVKLSEYFNISPSDFIRKGEQEIK